MKVVVVLASPYPAPRGSQLLVRQIERGLRRRGHAVTVVSYGPWLRDRTGLHPARPLLDLATLARLLWTARRERPDVLHAHNYEAALIGIVAARLLRIPLVFHGHSLMERELPSYVRSRRVGALLAWIGGWLDRRVPRAADHSVAVTTALAEVLHARGAAAVTVLRPVADPAEVAGFGALDAAAAAPTVAYAGNLDGYQNLELLVEAFRFVREAVPDARLEFVTHAPGRPAALAGEGIEVVCAASVGDAWRRLGRAWVAVVPRSEPSGHPMKVMNYMAAGKAIVTTAGAAHGLRDGVDAVVAEADPKRFASAIVDLLRDPERRARLGAAARAAVTDPGPWDGAMVTLEGVYRKAARTRPAVLPQAHATKES